MENGNLEKSFMNPNKFFFAEQAYLVVARFAQNFHKYVKMVRYNRRILEQVRKMDEDDIF